MSSAPEFTIQYVRDHDPELLKFLHPLMDCLSVRSVAVSDQRRAADTSAVRDGVYLVLDRGKRNAELKCILAV